MSKLTAAQRKLLIRARDYGSAWKIAARQSQPWRASTSRAIESLIQRGFLTRCGDALTADGAAALESK